MTMSVQSLGALFLAMVMLAALPGASVATVVSQAVTGGWKAAWACTAGIILGDLLYLAVAILGHVWLEQATGRAAWLLATGSGLYLLWVGSRLLRASPGLMTLSTSRTTLLRSGLAGLSITLADQKAIVFYFAFLPAFIEPGRATSIDFALIMAAMTVAIAAPKLTYAALAAELAERISSQAVILLRITGLMLLVVGGIILGRGLSLVPV